MTVVAICTPHAGRVPPEYYRHVLQMQGHPEGLKHQFLHVEIDHAIVGKARNACVEAAFQSNAEVLWFIDDDVLVPAEAALLVEQAMKLGVVSGMYFNRHPPYTPQLYMRANEPEYASLPNGVVYWPLMQYPEGLMVVDACGGGCLLVRREVFDKLKDLRQRELNSVTAAQASLDAFIDLSAQGNVPDHPRWQGLRSSLSLLTNHRPVMSPWFEFTDAKGEDMYFCERLREIGQVVWANTQVKCGHLSSIPITEVQFAFLKDHGLVKRLGPDGKPID